jgi:hypothetical protein
MALDPSSTIEETIPTVNLTRAIVVTAVAVFVSAGISACVSRQTASDDLAHTLVTFSEISYSSETGGTTQQHIEMYIADRQGRVQEIHFIIRIGANIIQERRWVSADSQTITVRSWEDCIEFSESMPPPSPDSLEIILEELFGPREIPKSAETTTDGVVRWSMTNGPARLTFADHGGAYPDRTITVSGESGNVAVVIKAGVVEPVALLPDWQSGWDSCAPVQA